MTYSNILIKHENGFTLVEMAIVLMIVGLLLGGMLVPLSAQMEQRNFSETRKTLDEIQQALIGYAIINGRLPCPADGTIATGQPNAGQENRDLVSGACAAAIITNSNAWGVLPWATLGVSETDAWGRRYTYHVADKWADGTDGALPNTGCNVTVGVSFQICSSSNLNVLTAATSGSNVATGIPAVIVSHGKNGFGAYTPNGGAAIGTSPDADEADNSDPDIHFVSKPSTATFDDLVVWISPNVLINRMVAAGRLP